MGLKDNVYRAVLVSSSFCGLQPLVARALHQSPRAVAFMNSEGRFRRLFHVEQRRTPLRCLLSGFRDKFCSRESLTHPRSFYVSSRCLVPSSFVCEFFTQHVALVDGDIHERRALCCEQQVSRAPWIVSGHPPFVPRVTSIPPSLHCTGMLGISLNNIGKMEVLKTDSR